MVAIAARSLADVDAEVALPQYRAPVVLASRGPQRVVDISAELGVNPWQLELGVDGPTGQATVRSGDGTRPRDLTAA